MPTTAQSMSRTPKSIHHRSAKTNRCTLDSGSGERSMGKECKFGLMVLSMKENGCKARQLVMGG
jgi:hypothetical protein